MAIVRNGLDGTAVTLLRRANVSNNDEHGGRRRLMAVPDDRDNGGKRQTILAIPSRYPKNPSAISHIGKMNDGCGGDQPQTIGWRLTTASTVSPKNLYRAKRPLRHCSPAPHTSLPPAARRFYHTAIKCYRSVFVIYESR